MIDSDSLSAGAEPHNRAALQSKLWALVLDKVPDEQVRERTRTLISLLESGAQNGEFPSETLDGLAKDLNPEQKYELCDIAGLLIHLQRAASITATHRDTRHETTYGKHNNDIFKMVGDLKHDHHLTIERAQTAIAKPAFDQVFTAHPTYIGDLAYTKALNTLDNAITQGEQGAISDAIGKLLEMSTVVQSRMKVQDETQLIKHFLTKAYEGIPALYEQLDDSFAQHFPEDSNTLAEQSYDPLKTRLNINFQAWGLSGDKDGNQNVNYHTTEDAVRTCRKTVCHLYQEDIRMIMEVLEKAPPDIGLRAQCVEMFEKLEKISKNTVATDPQSLDVALTALREFSETAYRTMKEAAAQTDDDKLRTMQEATAKRALGMRRNLDVFGLRLAQIEYREDAGMLKNVLDNIIAETGESGYARRTDEERERIIDTLLERAAQPDGLRDLNALKEQALIKIPRAAKGRDFNYRDTGAETGGNTGICYHTIKRLELAARNPDMFKGHVLAEASSPLEFKEMLLLLKLTGNEKNMRVIPLFENPTELSNVGEVMKTVQSDPHVRSYLLKLGLTEWQAKADKGLVEPLTQEMKNNIEALSEGRAEQETVEAALAKHKLSLSDILISQVQLAHSDNSRRGGVPGARTAVYKAHGDLREVAKETGMGIQFFEGGSHTDSFRMGTRSYSALNNTYGTHDFMKSTVQGMDIVQLFSNPITMQSFIGENIANAVKHTVADEKARPANDNAKEAPVLSTLIKTMKRYQDDYFTDDRLGYVMEQVFDYSFNQSCGTIASRSAKRGGAKKPASTQPVIYMDPVGGTRTIGYSEALQHAGVNPSFIGIRGVKDALKEGFGEVSQGAHAARARGGATSPEQKLHALYSQQSKAFKDVIDRIAFGVAMSDFDKVWDSAAHDYKSGFQQQKEIQFREENAEGLRESEKVKRPDSIEALTESAKEGSITGFFSELELEYREAAVLAYEAMTGNSLEGHENMNSRELRAAVRRILPMYQDHFTTSDVMLKLADTIEQTTSRDDMAQAYGKNGGERNVVNGLGKSLHALRDAAVLTRPPMRSEFRNRGLEKRAERGMAMA